MPTTKSMRVLISQYDSCTKRCAPSMATSRAVPGRRISKTEGLDRPNLDHFAKKSSSFSKINPQSIELRIFFIKFLKLN